MTRSSSTFPSLNQHTTMMHSPRRLCYLLCPWAPNLSLSCEPTETWISGEVHPIVSGVTDEVRKQNSAQPQRTCCHINRDNMTRQQAALGLDERKLTGLVRHGCRCGRALDIWQCSVNSGQVNLVRSGLLLILASSRSIFPQDPSIWTTRIFEGEQIWKFSRLGHAVAAVNGT